MTYIVKIGGAIVDNETTLDCVLDRCAVLGEPFVLVHGGGRIATTLAEQLGIKQTMIDGRRITDADTLKVVTMAYAGLINKNIVAKLQARDIQSIGMTGADANLVRAHKRTHSSIDYGFVGDIDAVNVDVLTMLLSNGISVVVAPLTHDGNGGLLNTNADTIAASIAIRLHSRAELNVLLRYLFEHPGVLRDIRDADSVIPLVRAEDIAALTTDGTIDKGMLPKITNAIDAAAA
ncbi:MAG: acetylglutamate kinase, partial [Candidatus Kapabacteria bacterium]|nr:acetylglutamate kinase [Candidatus Kapabacteria bacterium]